MSLATTTIALSIQIIAYFLLTIVTASSPRGFTMELIHRRFNVSSSSLMSKTKVGSSPYADTVFDTSEYLMKLKIGTPPFEIEVVLDTGNNIFWTQCLPCVHCFDQQDPVFDPSKSSTNKDGRCNSNSCHYEIIYTDQSYSKGTKATETVTLHSTSGKPFVMPEISIGCGHDNSREGSGASGVVGLGWGSSSLFSQMGDESLGFLSYCLAGKGTSKINFGANAVVSGAGTVATTMFKKNEKPSLYYLNLDAISVGRTRIETSGTSFHTSDGNIFIDSGTTYTYLPDGYCSQVKDAVDNVVPVERTSFSDKLLCYNSNTIEIFPVITMHLSGGADLVLEKYNMYVDVGSVFCLAIICVDPKEDYAVFGNRAQNNLLVGYDLYSDVVSFKPTDCSKLWG